MHVTTIRPTIPYCEPYGIWCARRKMQKKALKQYLRGRVFWPASQGTYVMPLCPLCGHKEKKCTCLDAIM